jgi:general nucleoside transport system permease protein
MTVTQTERASGAAPPDPGPPLVEPSGPAGPSAWRVRGRLVLRVVVAVAAATAVYAAFLVAKGADPAEVLQAMWESAFGDANSFGETLVRTAPLLLAALAVAVPARAGLFNIGGEGQLLLGAVGAAGTAYLVDDRMGTAPTLVAMALGGALAGMVWALIPAVLKLVASTNEAITTLLLNYVAAILLAWIVFEPWKDPTSFGQAYSESLEGPELLPILWGERVNIGIVIALAAALGVWFAFGRTRWGFKLSVVGGNPSAAKRAGFRVGGLTVGAMALGGALAGLGGMVEVAGVEQRLRPDMMVGFGYIGFLASWLARHHPLRAVGAAAALGAIAVGGNGLKIASGLSGAAVNILMALVLLAVLGWGRPSETGAEAA